MLQWRTVMDCVWHVGEIQGIRKNVYVGGGFHEKLNVLTDSPKQKHGLPLKVYGSFVHGRDEGGDVWVSERDYCGFIDRT